MNTRITKNELIAINTRLAQENAVLRTMLSAQEVLTKVANSRRESASTGSGSGKQRRPLASFWALADAGQYITSLKQRGCKTTLTAIRDGQHFVVYAG